MDGLSDRLKWIVDERVPSFDPSPALPGVILAIVRCGYSALAASFQELATAVAKEERAGQKPALDSQTCVACSIAAERYANECQAVMVGGLRPDVQLLVDLQRWRVRFGKCEIPTSGPHGLTPQAVVALAALALHSPEPLSMAELGLEMERLAEGGDLSRSIQSGEGLMRKYILRKIRTPFIGAGVPREAVDALFDVPRNGRLRLTLLPQQVRVDEGANMVRSRVRRRPGQLGT